MGMMLHRHFDATRTEAEKPRPAAPAEPEKKIVPATDVKEGEDIVQAPAAKRARKR